MVDELISENLEPFLAPPNLSRMDIKSLIGLRDQLDQRLREHRVKLQKQLERIALLGGERVRRGGGSALKGIKVPHRNIVVLRVRPGQVVAQNLVGLSRR